MERLTGIPVSPGVVVGRAVVLTGHSDVVRFPIPPDRVDHELELLDQARARSHAQLQEIRDRLANGPGHDLAPLFDAQLLILDDSMFMGRARDIVRHDRVNAAWAVHRAYEELCAIFATVEDPYLRERDSDLADVAGRIRMNLRRAGGWASDLLRDVDGPAVLVADELTASLAAQMDWSRVLGFATDAGGRTHHTAILARSLRVPAVVGLRDLSHRVSPGTPIVIDGTSGTVTIDPVPADIEEARRHAPARRTLAVAVADGPLEPTLTADGVAIRLDANLERLEDVPAVLEAGAEGIGLFRSEFLLAERSPDRLTEERQYAIYRDLLTAMAPRPVTVRTFDLDERQLASPMGRDRRDARPGRRGVRLGLARPDVLRTQLRALLRAAPAGTLRVMFPFVTSVEEMRLAKGILDDVARDLGRPAGAVPVGAMVEVPSAAVAADLLAGESTFFTVGTNDLIQYTLAVDRTDERLSDLYEPLHPAVIRLLRLVRRAAARRKIDASVCGEMASDPALIGLLIGLGFRAFSMTPSAIPGARRLVRELRVCDARRTASEALKLPTAADIEQHLFEALAATTRDRASQ
ncbi:MAG: phosphoenolpyruvate--protein phosphotransferase [Vicinamibacterales bacterium]